VLVVDDDAVSRHVLVAALGRAGLTSVALASGQAALDWLEENTPSVVLLDLVMPPPDGYDILRVLRARDATRGVPAVVLTALDADEEIERAFAEGADDFLRKPFRPAELVARIRGQLRLRQYVETIARREHDAKVLLELTQVLASTLDLRDILHTVVRRIAEVTQVDRCSIVLVRDTGDVGYVVASNDDQQVRDLPLDLDKYPEIREVMKQGMPLVVSDATTHPLFDVLRPDSSPTYASLAIVPILHEARPMGVLFLRSRSPAQIDQNVVSLARTIANTTAIALRNARIFQSLKNQTAEVTVARYEAERRLRVTQRYADFFELAADGIVVVDREGPVLFTNRMAREICGYTADEIHGKELLAFIAPDDAPRIAELAEGFARGEYPQNFDLRIVRKDTRRILLSINSSPLPEDNALLFSFRDVTEERALAEELRRTKGFLERVIESSVDAILSADLKGNILLFNRAAERCYGWKADEVIGKRNVATLYPDGVAKHIMQLIRTGGDRVEALDTHVLTRDGEEVPVSLSAALIFENGKPVGSVGIFTDLREKLRMESQLVAVQEALELREKQAIIAELAGAAAHELNQPLTSVMGYAELLKRRLDRDSPAWGAAEVIVNEAERMAEIVRKIGKITRYETKTYVGHAKIIDLDRASSDEPTPSSRTGVPPSRLP
jgi:PAS domain S-box-containing protein